MIPQRVDFHSNDQPEPLHETILYPLAGRICYLRANYSGRQQPQPFDEQAAQLRKNDAPINQIDMSAPTHYPLQWPSEHGRSPASQREKSSIKTPVPTLWKSIHTELKQWKTGGIVSSNLKLKNDGTLYAKQPRLEDTGVALYFVWHGTWYAISMDHYTDVAGNLKEIRELLATFRRMGNVYNVGMRRKMLELVATISQPTKAESKPPPRQQQQQPPPKPKPEPKGWRAVLGVPNVCPYETVKAAYNRLAKENHPDRGGSTARMQQINEAHEQAKKFYRIGIKN